MNIEMCIIYIFMSGLLVCTDLWDPIMWKHLPHMQGGATPIHFTSRQITPSQFTSLPAELRYQRTVQAGVRVSNWRNL